MGRKGNIILIIVILTGVLSCRVSRPGSAPVVITATAADYINTYRDLAVSEMRRSGVPASITLAQGMLESDYGRSTLARMANNHFGIKCHSDWKGETFRKDDDRRNECFRKYRSVEESYRDHSDFLMKGSRYRFLFDLDPADYKAWAHGLKRAGYATDPQYAGLLIRKIEENSLYAYDRGYVAGPVKPSVSDNARTTLADQGQTVRVPPAAVTESGKKPALTADSGQTFTSAPSPVNQNTITFGNVMARVPRIMENNRIQYIIVKDGETRESIEKEFQLMRWELSRYNDLGTDFTILPGQILYLEPKRDKAASGNEFHTVTEGETMHLISQRYGIKLKSLLDMNSMSPGTEPSAGQKIWLQSQKPAN